MQLSLFGRGDPTFDPVFSTLKHVDLGFGSWLEYAPGWLSGHAHAFEMLRESVGWQHHRREMYERIVDVPRLTAEAPGGYDISPLLAQMSAMLSNHYGRSLNSISLALYRDGRDSVAPHGDKMGDLVDDCVIAIVSVGEPRKLLLKPAAGGASRSFWLGWGDLFVMGGRCQRTHLHGVPKTRAAAPRISIMFRQAVPKMVHRNPQAKPQVPALNVPQASIRSIVRAS